MNRPFSETPGDAHGQNWQFCRWLDSLILAKPNMATGATVVLTFLAFPPFHLGWLMWFSLVPWLVAVQRTKRLITALSMGFACGLGLALLVMDWIRSAYTSGILGVGPYWWCWLLVGLCSGVSWGIGAGVLWLLTERRLSLIISAPVMGFVVETLNDNAARVVAGTTADLLRVAMTQVNSPAVMQLAHFGGAEFVAIFVWSINGLCSDVLRSRRDAREFPSLWRLVPLGLMILGVAVGTLTTILQSGDAKREHQIQVALHPAGELHAGDGFSYERLNVDLAVCAEMAAQPSLRDWIEVRGNHPFKHNNRNCVLLIGGRWVSESPLGIFNSLALIKADGTIVGRYDKRWLSPVQETSAPFQKWWCRAWGVTRTELFSAGNRVPRFRLDRGETFAVGICHEVVFPEWIRETMRLHRPDFVVVCSSESFDRTWRVQALLLAVTQLRAAECQRPIVRCVRDGYSGVVLPNGQVLNCRETLDKLTKSEMVVSVPVPLNLN